MGAVRRSTGTTFRVLRCLLCSIKGRTTGSNDNNNNNNNNKLLYRILGNFRVAKFSRIYYLADFTIYIFANP